MSRLTGAEQRLGRPWTGRRGLLVAVLLLAAALVASWRRRGPVPRDRGGPAHLPPVPFRLHDQWGQPRSLEDARGRVAVLTFMYTNCPDVCPLHAEALRRAYGGLGGEAEHVAFLVVSVDPDGDTPEAARGFSEAHGMLERWWYLVGGAEALEPVWRGYYVASQEVASGEGHPTAVGPVAGVQEPEKLAHSAPVYVLDRQGRARVVLTGLGLDPQNLVHDIRLLARERD